MQPYISPHKRGFEISINPASPEPGIQISQIHGDKKTIVVLNLAEAAEVVEQLPRFIEFFTPEPAIMVGASFEDVATWLDELRQSGVFSEDEHGCIHSRRMIRDESLRESRANGGKLGGNPALIGEGKVNLPPNLGDNLHGIASAQPVIKNLAQAHHTFRSGLFGPKPPLIITSVGQARELLQNLATFDAALPTA